MRAPPARGTVLVMQRHAVSELIRRRADTTRERATRVAIVGGGIGGMSLALSLRAAGFREVDVYESAPSVRELGVGFNLLAHGTRELAELGLLAELYAIGIPTAELVYFSKHGQRIWREPRGLAAGSRWPQLSIHRGQLLGVLHRAVRERLGPERVHPGHHLAEIVQDGSRVRAEFADRVDGRTRAVIDADLLVGSDGIHSATRRLLMPDEGPPRWNGMTMWRAVTDGEPFLSGRTMIIAGHPARQIVVASPISRRHEDQGRALINWVAGVKLAAGGAMPEQDWEYTTAHEPVAEAFGSFAFDWLDFPALIAGADTIYQFPVADRDPLPTWSFGRVTLLGDAAHPMYPIGSNGASQAIIDARVLARELTLRPSVPDAIAAYDEQRRPATAKVVLANRRGANDRVLELVEQRAPDGFTDIEAVVSRAELEEIANGYMHTAGFDPQTLNKRPSLSVRAGRRSKAA
jgi:2-polyprenyl-6-methoxyphenol hydroxylase-like FAD-dependent oxidoreductase